MKEENCHNIECAGGTLNGASRWDSQEGSLGREVKGKMTWPLGDLREKPLDRGDSSYKGPEVGLTLACWKERLINYVL